ncbi:MAG: FAD-dependent oxidoreductase [Aliarcobacter sp.]|nr:FAD-dependent oxidoreductase [Aliarcobacter sp.]
MIDVLIIGSGIAGLTAALNASKNNSKVLVVSKTYPTHSQSVQAQGGINAVLYEDEDSVNMHMEDTYKAAHKLANKENINFMCKEAANTIYWLDSIGVPFNRDLNDKIAQRKFGGTKKIRTCYSSDYTGLKILHTLFDQCIKENIDFKNEHLVLNLIVEDNTCIGITALNIQSGIVNQILAKTVIIASGGYAGIFTNHTTNSYSNTADGIAMAYNAGCELSNMEFIQFHPTTLENSNILISESARGEGGYLVNQDEERFIDELKPRDEVARAIYENIKQGHKVYLDLRHLGLDKIKEVMPQERVLALEFSNVKLENELLSITPAAHYSMGGIKTDINCKTNISNLYACGECAQSFIHGANRLGGNSLLEIVTFGKIAGLNASTEAKNIDDFEISNSLQFDKDKKLIKDIYSLPNKINFYEKKEYLGNLLFDDLGLFRTESKMNELLIKIDEIANDLKNMGIGDKSKIYNKNLVEFIEFKNSLKVSKIATLCAINRKESRGSHYRIDYPNSEINFEKCSLILKTNDSITISFEELQ